MNNWRLVCLLLQLSLFRTTALPVNPMDSGSEVSGEGEDIMEVNEGDEKMTNVDFEPRDDKVKKAEEAVQTPMITVPQSSLAVKDQMVIAELVAQPKEKEIVGHVRTLQFLYCQVRPVPIRTYLMMMRQLLWL